MSGMADHVLLDRGGSIVVTSVLVANITLPVATDSDCHLSPHSFEECMSRHPDPIPAGEVSIAIFELGQLRFKASLDGVWILGRQRSNEPPPLTRIDTPAANRLVVAKHTDQTVSRDHLRISAAGDGFLLANLSSKCSIDIDPGPVLTPGKQREMTGTVRVRVGGFVLVLEPSPVRRELISLGTPNDYLNPESMSLLTLASDGSTSNPRSDFRQSLVATIGSSFDQQQQSCLMQWLQATAWLFRHATDGERFCKEAVSTIQRMVAADMVLAFSIGSGVSENRDTTQPHNSSEMDWQMEASISTDEDEGWAPPKYVFDRICETRHNMLYRDHWLPTDRDPSGRRTVNALLVPWLNTTSDVTGLFCAARFSSHEHHAGVDPPTSFGTLEASLLELVASEMTHHHETPR
ncbi:MAG: hypothetical protein AAGJ40_16425 [Planctomycetota bacterium]